MGVKLESPLRHHLSYSSQWVSFENRAPAGEIVGHLGGFFCLFFSNSHNFRDHGGLTRPSGYIADDIMKLIYKQIVMCDST